MGKKRDAYEKAVAAEGAAISRNEREPSEQNRVEVEQNTRNADFLRDEWIMSNER